MFYKDFAAFLPEDEGPSLRIFFEGLSLLCAPNIFAPLHPVLTQAKELRRTCHK